MRDLQDCIGCGRCKPEPHISHGGTENTEKTEPLKAVKD